MKIHCSKPILQLTAFLTFFKSVCGSPRKSGICFALRKRSAWKERIFELTAYTRFFKAVCGSLRKKCIHVTLRKKKTNNGEKASFNEQLLS